LETRLLNRRGDPSFIATARLAIGLPLVIEEMTGLKGMSWSGTLTIPFEAGISATVTWGPELGWYVSIMAAILMFVGFFVAKIRKG